MGYRKTQCARRKEEPCGRISLKEWEAWECDSDDEQQADEDVNA